MTKNIVWIDGKMVPKEEAKIGITCHTLHYGSGVFEGMRCYSTENNAAVFRLHDHIKRLFKSFENFEINLPWTEKEIAQAVIDTIKINNLDDCYIRPIIFFGDESLLISPKELSLHCAIIALPMEKYLGKDPIKVGFSNIKKLAKDSMPINSKINGSYANSIFAFNDVKKRGFDDAILLDQNGNIAEGSVANIFFVKNNKIVTPTLNSILPGITRDSILKIAKHLNIEIVEQDIKPDDIFEKGFTEAFFTGTASEITPIKSIENIEFNAPGKITNDINQIYQNIVKNKDNAFLDWLTFLK